MNIFPMQNNFSYPYFSSRKKEIKDADMVQRRAKAVFPLVSPTYVESFYKTYKPSDYNLKSTRFISSCSDKITFIREMQQFPSYYASRFKQDELTVPYGITLVQMKKDKAGNCLENSLAALAALYANGYTNSNLANVRLKVEFINNDTQKSDAIYYMPLDHSVAITDMNRGGKKDIVLDPWLNFADSKDKAIARYKSVYSDNEIYEARSWAKYYFSQALNRMGKPSDISNYKINQNIVLVESDTYTPEQLAPLQKFASEHFGDLVIKKDED